MEIDWLDEAKRNLKNAHEAVLYQDINNDEVLQKLVEDVGSTILYSLVSLADSLKRIADAGESKVFG